jgi:hypothetical protein
LKGRNIVDVMDVKAFMVTVPEAAVAGCGLVGVMGVVAYYHDS